MEYYGEIKKAITEQVGELVVIHEDNGLLDIDISVGSRRITMKIQGEDVPEIDVQFENVKRYHSARNISDMVKYVNLVLNDVEKLINFKGEVEFKQNKLLGIFGITWKVINPTGLAILG